MKVLAPIYGLTDAGEEAQRLEAAGVDGAFTFEGPHDVFLPLAVAATASNLSLMSNVAIAFPRNAVHMAHSAWDLQQLSQHRFTLGLGTQIRTHIERRFGEEFDHPVERMRDSVGALRAVFSAWQDGAPLNYLGEYRSHTLMTPIFSPQPSEFGSPLVVVGGLGPRMCAMAAEVADGLAVMPVTSEQFFTERTLPAVQRGLDRRVTVDEGADNAFEVLPELIVGVGRNAAEQAVADAGCRSLLGFYSSTPAYQPVFEIEGKGHIQPIARNLTREGKWEQLADLIDDELLGAIAVRGTPQQVAQEISRRYSAHTGRVAIYTPYGLAEGLFEELISEIHAIS
ncbi:MAG: TIGR03617 family F420-dependent LLM class oxidoreductase [Microthrixaceae bacterium]